MLREPVATCLEVALATGLRIGDIVELTPEQVKGDIIEYTARKTGKSGIAKLPPELADRLHNPWFAAGAWVFKSPRGGDKHISRGTVCRIARARRTPSTCLSVQTSKRRGDSFNTTVYQQRCFTRSPTSSPPNGAATKPKNTTTTT